MNYDIIKGNKQKTTKIITKRDAQAKQVKHINLGCSKANK
jgi:hypothetical protein